MFTNSCNVVPETNQAVFCYLYKIEVGLREFLIFELSATCGSKWWKQRLPNDMLEKSREGVASERASKWTQLVPHHPIYYIDFPDLRKIIERNDNWRDVFQSVFSDKNVFSNALRELEPVRNKVAHNRKATAVDLRITEAVLAMFVSAVGEKRFDELVQQCTQAPDIAETLTDLAALVKSTLTKCNDLVPITGWDLWPRVSNSWWFDDAYLGHAIEDTTRYFALVDEYRRLHRARGNGYLIEGWVRAHPLSEVSIAASAELALILAEAGDA